MAGEVTPFHKDVTLATVDQAIKDWFDSTVDAHVKDPTGERLKVPVVLASGERWVTAKDRRGIRDKDGRIRLPIVSIRRSSLDISDNMMALGTNVPRMQISRRVSEETSQLKNQIKNRPLGMRRLRDPVVYEITSIPFPVNATVTYELIVQTQYIQQMNQIVEKMLSQLEYFEVPQFVALTRDHRPPPDGDIATGELEREKNSPYEDRKPLDQWYFVGFFDSSVSDSGNFEEFTDQERIVRFTTTFRVPVALQLDPEGQAPSVKVERTAFDLRFSSENVITVDDPADLDKIFGPRR